MISDYTVLIQYKNKKMQKVGESVYPFSAYTLTLSQGLKNCLSDIENVFREQFGEDVNLKENEKFMNIRREILNAANAVERLPGTMCYKGTPISAISASEYITSLINN